MSARLAEKTTTATLQNSQTTPDLFPALVPAIHRPLFSTQSFSSSTKKAICTYIVHKLDHVPISLFFVLHSISPLPKFSEKPVGVKPMIGSRLACSERMHCIILPSYTHNTQDTLESSSFKLSPRHRTLALVHMSAYLTLLLSIVRSRPQQTLTRQYLIHLIQRRFALHVFHKC